MKSIYLAAAMVLAGLSQTNAGSFVNGNDTGGIIPWSHEAQINRKLIAAEHCAHYDKDARITSVYPQYGNYIGFACFFRAPAVVHYRGIRARHRAVVLRSRG
jgi:hypothetical protein